MSRSGTRKKQLRKHFGIGNASVCVGAHVGQGATATNMCGRIAVEASKDLTNWEATYMQEAVFATYDAR